MRKSLRKVWYGKELTEKDEYFNIPYAFCQ